MSRVRLFLLYQAVIFQNWFYPVIEETFSGKTVSSSHPIRSKRHMFSWSFGKFFYVFLFQKKASHQAFVGQHRQRFLRSTNSNSALPQITSSKKAHPLWGSFNDSGQVTISMITIYLLDHGDRAKKERGPGRRGLWLHVFDWESLAPLEEMEGVCKGSAQHSPVTGKHVQYTYLHFSPVRLLYVK